MTGEFTRSIKEFVDASPWLGPLDAPALAALKAMAETLDSGDLTPAMLSAFGLAYRALLKRAPLDAPPEDEFEALLAEGREGA